MTSDQTFHMRIQVSAEYVSLCMVGRATSLAHGECSCAAASVSRSIICSICSDINVSCEVSWLFAASKESTPPASLAADPAASFLIASAASQRASSCSTTYVRQRFHAALSHCTEIGLAKVHQ